jgi:hypothetical protein
MRDKIKSIFSIPSPLKKTVLFEQVIPVISEKEMELNSKVKVDSGLHFDGGMKKLSQDFLDYVADHFELEDYPTIHILAERNKGMTYGAFDPNTNEIMVYGKDRGFADILRTAAHELTHYWQKVQGKIPDNLQGRDHGLESEANTQAGDLIYMFGLEHPEVYQLGVKSDTVETPVN